MQVVAEKGDRDGKGGARLSPLVLVMAAALLWSTGGLFIKATSLSAYELSFGRSLLAAATLAYLTRREGFRLNLVTAATAVLYAALLLLFVIATKLTSAANAIFLQYTAPLYILILEPWFYKQKFRASDLIVVGVCLGGMVLFFVGKLRPEDVSGNLAALASGLCFALFVLLLRHPRAREVNRASSAIYGNLLLSLVCFPAFIAGAHKMTGVNFGAVVFLGVFQIGIAYALFTLGMARGVRSLDAGIISYIEPVLNPVWVYIFLRERPSGWAVAGGAIIISAVIAHTIHKGMKTRLH